MHFARRPVLRTWHNSRRNTLFSNHVRIGAFIFRRPCSCTAALTDEQKSTPISIGKTLTPTTNDPPRPPADHRDLAIAQGLFTTSPYSPGSPLLLPNGSDMFNKLAACLRSLYPKFGFREVITPTIYKKSLWEKSGHWENYADDMFEVRGRGASGQKEDTEIGEDESFGLKPMNCPGHCLLFASEKRSYRDLPIRYADFSALHRNEISGALSGLTRVRRFHQDDGHIFCRPSQIETEIRKTMDFIQLVYGNIFDLGPYRLVLSTRPHDKYIGSKDEWDSAEAQLKSALDHSGREWSINEGDGAFYGPKIDIILRDSDGKEHQTATIQLDFQLPQRFGLEYVAPAPELERKGVVKTDTDPDLLKTTGMVTPVIIHRAILGSLERFMALLIEHYNGCYPFWISPRPAIILTIHQADEVLEYVEQVRETAAIHVDVDSSARPLGKKINEAKKKGYNFIIVVGSNDVENKTVSLEMANQHIGNIEAYKQMLPTNLQSGKDGKHKGVIDLLVLQEFFTKQQKNYL